MGRKSTAHATKTAYSHTAEFVAPIYGQKGRTGQLVRRVKRCGLIERASNRTYRLFGDRGIRRIRGKICSNQSQTISQNEKSLLRVHLYCMLLEICSVNYSCGNALTHLSGSSVRILPSTCKIMNEFSITLCRIVHVSVQLEDPPKNMSKRQKKMLFYRMASSVLACGSFDGSYPTFLAPVSHLLQFSRYFPLDPKNIVSCHTKLDRFRFLHFSIPPDRQGKRQTIPRQLNFDQLNCGKTIAAKVPCTLGFSCLRRSNAKSTYLHNSMLCPENRMG
jgi:hypothetical protein